MLSFELSALLKKYEPRDDLEPLLCLKTSFAEIGGALTVNRSLTESSTDAFQGNRSFGVYKFDI